jgi:hypothetical protein
MSMIIGKLLVTLLALTGESGDVEVEVSAGEGYYIPHDSDHVLGAAPGELLTVI